MACRGFPSPRERLSARDDSRRPVHDLLGPHPRVSPVLLTVVLFPGRPLHQAAAFTACYSPGIGAGLRLPWSPVIIARGPARGMAMELPHIHLLLLRTALITTYDRGLVFVRMRGDQHPRDLHPALVASSRTQVDSRPCM